MQKPAKPRFRIYPSIGVARVGNGPAHQADCVFSPEVPWANLYETDQQYYTEDGRLKKQAQRFYVYHCDEEGRPTHRVNPNEYAISWKAEVANKKPFWYDFNNSLDLSVQSSAEVLSERFLADGIAPGKCTTYRNPNVLNQSLRVSGEPNFREELVNGPVSGVAKSGAGQVELRGKFPFPRTYKKEKVKAPVLQKFLRKKNQNLQSLAPEGDAEHLVMSTVAAALDISPENILLGTLENDNGSLIFYAGDGVSEALNPSDLNTDFADNSNWYDDICDGRITAVLTPLDSSQADVSPIVLDGPDSAAWIVTAPPNYAPQIDPLSTMFDLITAVGSHADTHQDLGLVFPLMYRLYRMQWVNLGDFLAPSFKEMVDGIIQAGKFNCLYEKAPGWETVRKEVLEQFRYPQYAMANEPVIPSASKTDLVNAGSGREELLLPYYPGDGIDYPGSPAQWFAIPPLLYQELKKWSEGQLNAPAGKTFADMDALGRFYQQQFLNAAQDDAKLPLLMTRAVMESLYGGAFHPGVELTWPLRHSALYSENSLVYPDITDGEEKIGLYGLREIRLNAASPAEQADIFFNDFGFQMSAKDIAESLQDPSSPKAWLWKVTPGDMTKWMGIPWQSDAGSCQAVYTDSQYPVPAWWAANLPVYVLTKASLDKVRDTQLLKDTRMNIYANRQLWLETTDTGYVGYHAEGGYTKGLINMVYKWKEIGIVAGRESKTDLEGVPKIVYVAFDPDDAS